MTDVTSQAGGDSRVDWSPLNEDARFYGLCGSAGLSDFESGLPWRERLLLMVKVSAAGGWIWGADLILAVGWWSCWLSDCFVFVFLVEDEATIGMGKELFGGSLYCREYNEMW